MKRIYLSGKITGDPNYRDKFAKAEAHYKTFGHAVMNPAVLPLRISTFKRLQK